eukprot:gene32050-42767_t
MLSTHYTHYLSMPLVNLSPTEESYYESLCSLRLAKQVNQCELGKPKKQLRDMVQAGSISSSQSHGSHGYGQHSSSSSNSCSSSSVAASPLASTPTPTPPHKRSASGPVTASASALGQGAVAAAANKRLNARKG